MAADDVVQQWFLGADRALQAAAHMSKSHDYEFALFTLHLAVEKALKGLYIKNNDNRPPKSHNLEELAELCRMDVSEEERLELRELTTFAEFGRYGDASWIESEASSERARFWLQKGENFISRCKAQR